MRAIVPATPADCVFWIYKRGLFAASRPNVVATLAETHEIIDLQPELGRVDDLADVVDFLCWRADLVFEAVLAERILIKLGFANVSPLAIVAAFAC